LEVHHPKAFDEICKENNVSTVEQALECKELWNVNNGISICYRCHKDVEKLRTKLRKIIEIISRGDHTESVFIGFIRNVIRESKCRHRTKGLRNYIKQHKIQYGTNSPYSILKPAEMKRVAEEIIWIDKKLKKHAF
jgi:hypothetical protein